MRDRVRADVISTFLSFRKVYLSVLYGVNKRSFMWRPHASVYPCVRLYQRETVCRLLMKSGYEFLTVGCGAGVSFVRMDAATDVLYLRVLVNFNP